MAITYVGVNNAAGQNNGNTGSASLTLTPTLPSGTAAGDRVFVYVIGTGTSAVTPTGWTPVFTGVIIGSGSLAAGSGQRTMACYYRDYDGAWSMPIFSLAFHAAPSMWVAAVSVRPTSGYVFDAPTFSGHGSTYNAASTSYTDTSSGGFTTVAGGFLLIATALNDNVTSTTSGLTQSGASFGTVTERADGGTATGNDVSGKVHTTSVTTGATGTTTFTLTLSAASQGETKLVQQTEYLPNPVSNVVDAFEGVSTTPDVAIWTTTSPAVVDTANDRLSLPGNNAQVITSYSYGLSNSAVFAGPLNVSGSATTASTSLTVTNSGLTVLVWIDISPLTGIATANLGFAAQGTRTHTNGDWYRLRHSGSTIYYDYSTDGATWTNFATAAAGSLNLNTNLAVRLRAVATGGAASITATWGGVNHLPPGPPISGFFDDFTGTDGDPPDPAKWTTDGNIADPELYNNGLSLAVAGSGSFQGVTSAGVWDLTAGSVTYQTTGAIYPYVLLSDGALFYHGVVTEALGLYGFVAKDVGGNQTVQAQAPSGLIGSPIPLSFFMCFRVRESSGTVYMEYSLNFGTSWSTLSSVSVGSNNITRVRFYANNLCGGGGASYAGIDSVNTPFPTVGPSSSITDDFSTGSAPDATKWGLESSSAAAVSGGVVTMGVDSVYYSRHPDGSQLFTLDSVKVKVLSPGTYAGLVAEIGGIMPMFWNVAPGAGGAQPFDDSTPVGTPRTHTSGDWYRIRSDYTIDTLYWEWSSNGSTWNIAHSTTGAAAFFGSGELLTRAAISGTGAVLDNYNLDPPPQDSGKFFAMF